MKFYVAIAALTIAVLSGPVPDSDILDDDDGTNVKYFLVETADGEYEIEDLVNAEVDTRASESDLSYHFFSVHDPVAGTTVQSNNLAILTGTEFQGSKDTMFVVHGWKDNNESTYNSAMREVLLSRFDVNLFVVDWEPIAAKNYISAKKSVVKVGNYIASFIQSLESTYGLDVTRVSFVGFSLGAHIAGSAGAALGGRAHHIVGLDPAGPLFSSRKIDERLDPTDAQFVEVIHTNGGTLGYNKALGHADYYPNGGSSQPGCLFDFVGSCAHARAYIYYGESVVAGRNAFLAKRCSSYLAYQLGFCKSNEVSLMAGYEVDNRASGSYYLKTNKKAPYAKG